MGLPSCAVYGALLLPGCSGQDEAEQREKLYGAVRAACCNQVSSRLKGLCCCGFSQKAASAQ